MERIVVQNYRWKLSLENHQWKLTLNNYEWKSSMVNCKWKLSLENFWGRAWLWRCLRVAIRWACGAHCKSVVLLYPSTSGSRRFDENATSCCCIISRNISMIQEWRNRISELTAKSVVEYHPWNLWVKFVVAELFA